MSDYPRVSEGILGEHDITKNNTELFLSLVGQFFPEAIKDGEVDFSALKEELGEFLEVGSEHYNFTWAGKQSAKKVAQADLFGKTLRYKPKDSLESDTTENIYIEGDNLEGLKLLRRNYYGKIKMIYIDPPYNTGNDFVYHDDFSMSEEELAELSGDVVDGVRFQKNLRDGSRYHTNWLNMIYPRLRVARELLSDQGVIFISIDDTEVGNLRKVCDDVFGSNNFVANVIWEKKYTVANDAKYFSDNHDHILCYAKSIESFEIGRLPRTDEMNAAYKNPDNHPKGVWKATPLHAKSGSANGADFSYTFKNGVTFTPPAGTYPRYSAETLKKFDENDEIWFGKDGTAVPSRKTFLCDLKNSGIVPRTIIDFNSGGHNHEAVEEVKQLLNDNLFTNPKPVKLIKLLLTIGNVQDDDIVLDFFSGSATTGHAVMQLNAEDGGRRKFILIQLPEICDEKSEAAKAGYPTICEIGKERLRKASQKIHEDMPDAKFDGGFKVFTIGGTTIRWNLMNDEELTELDKVSNDTEKLDFTDGHNDTDIVYEIMLRQYGISLSTPIEKLSEVSERTYAFADAVVVCLEPVINDELITKLSAIEPIPAKYVIRDSAFGDNIELKDVTFRKLSALIRNHQTDEERKSKYNNYTVEFI